MEDQAVEVVGEVGQREFGADEPLVWYEGSGTSDRRWLHTDERGSVVAVSTGGGAASIINSYDEYGIPASTNAGRFQYTGQMWIPELGMYYYKARIYSPTLGRFMQTDPIGYKDGINWYAYVGNDPVNFGDTNGRRRIAFIDGNNVTVVMFIKYSGPGATAEVKSKFNQAIERHWSGKFGNINLTTIVREPRKGVRPDLYNTVYVPKGDGRASVTDGHQGNWPADRPGWTAAHEAGLFGNLPDTYGQPGIMGTRDDKPTNQESRSMVYPDRYKAGDYNFERQEDGSYRSTGPSQTGSRIPRQGTCRQKGSEWVCS